MKKRFRTVRLSDVRTDPRVNRPLDQHWVDYLVKNWEGEAGKEMVSPPVLSDRGDYFIPLDGQHRIEAVREMTVDDPRIECIVYTGLELKDEARMFLTLNKDRSVIPFFRFTCSVTAEDPDALSVTRIVESLGLHIDKNGNKGTVSATEALQRVFRWDRSGDLLRASLAIPMKAWGKDSSSFSGNVLTGIALFLRTFPEASNNGRISKVLSRNVSGGYGLIGKAKPIREVEGGTVPGAIAKVVQSFYNKGLKNKLVRT